MKPSIDVESLRSEHESDEQWDVRRSFMLEHKDSFDEEELVTLAQLFTNIEFLGCRYPAPTMKRIAKLAEKVSKRYKESRKNKLKRTFVQASDAAEQKAKRSFKKSISGKWGVYPTRKNIQWVYDTKKFGELWSRSLKAPKKKFK